MYLLKHSILCLSKNTNEYDVSLKLELRLLLNSFCLIVNSTFTKEKFQKWI